MRGFTLVEFIIYVGILSIVLVLITGFLWTIVLGNIKETSFLEIQQNARFALAKIIHETKKATGINSAGDNFLSLQMADPNLNPTVFDVDGGKLRITQGTNGPYDLTSDQVIVSALTFTNLSYPDTPGTIQIEMTIDYINPGNLMEYQASVNLKSTVALILGGAAAPVLPSYLAQLHYRWRNDDGGE